MIRGLYTATSGMLAGLLRYETIVHNLSNVQTVGYKADRAVLTDFPSLLLNEIRQGEVRSEIGEAGTGVSLGSLNTDFEEGPFKLTEHSFDFAVAGDGFFRLDTPDGIRYTRDGRFHRDTDGSLINADGYRVIGVDGPITVPEGQLTANPQGELFVGDTVVGQFSLAHFENLEDLAKDGQTMFINRDEEPQLMAANEVQIYQGYLEESNVDTAQAVTEMMSILRAYQASQRLVQFQDQINGQAANELGRV